MAHMLRTGDGFSSQQLRGPSPSSSRPNSSSNTRYPAQHQRQLPSLDTRALLQHLDNFIRYLNEQPSAIPEEQYRLSVLIQPLKSDTNFCAEICQHLWKCCLHSGLSRTSGRSNGQQAAGDGSANSASFSELSTYDFARLCNFFVNVTAIIATQADLQPPTPPFFKALLTLCSNNYDDYVKSFLERHDQPSKNFDKNALKLVLQINADLISQMDNIQLLKSAMFIIIRACYSIIHVEDRRRDAPSLSEELLFTATTSVLRVAGPKIDDPTVVAHLLKDYPTITQSLNLWEEIFTQVRNILISGGSGNDEASYSPRVKTQLLALLEARAGYWGMLSSQYAAMQGCASAYVAGDPQAYGAACAEYYTTFGNGISSASSVDASPTTTGNVPATVENVQLVSNFMAPAAGTATSTNYAENQFQQGVVTEPNYYAASGNRPSTLVPAAAETTGERQHNTTGGGDDDDYEQYLRLNGLPPEIDDDAEAEFEKFQSGEGVMYGGGGGDGDFLITQSMRNMGLNNGVRSGSGATENGGEPGRRFG